LLTKEDLEQIVVGNPIKAVAAFEDKINTATTVLLDTLESTQSEKLDIATRVQTQKEMVTELTIGLQSAKQIFYLDLTKH
jgi:hypothetical protein